MNTATTSVVLRYIIYTMTWPSFMRIPAAVLPLLFLLAGCGGLTSAPPAATSTQNTTGALLKGNWLIIGDLPFPLFPLANTPKFSLTSTIDVINGQVVTTSNDYYSCGSSAVGGGSGFGPATIAADGTFTLQTLQPAGFPTPTVLVTLHGSVPQTAGAWSGTYSASNSNFGCTPVSGTFTAVPIQPLTGTFTGTGSMSPANSNISVAESIAVTLQQGGPASLDTSPNYTIVNSVNQLTGSITVTGSTCFKNGTLTGVGGHIDGNEVGAIFMMDDGSNLFLSGTLKDTAATTVSVLLAHVSGGACNGWIGFSQASLVKQ